MKKLRPLTPQELEELQNESLREAILELQETLPETAMWMKLEPEELNAMNPDELQETRQGLENELQKALD